MTSVATPHSTARSSGNAEATAVEPTAGPLTDRAVVSPPASGKPRPERRYDVDMIRILATLAVILLHTSHLVDKVTPGRTSSGHYITLFADAAGRFAVEIARVDVARDVEQRRAGGLAFQQRSAGVAALDRPTQPCAPGHFTARRRGDTRATPWRR